MDSADVYDLFVSRAATKDRSLAKWLDDGGRVLVYPVIDRAIQAVDYRHWTQTYAQWRDDTLAKLRQKYPTARAEMFERRADFAGHSDAYLGKLEAHIERGGLLTPQVWDDALKRLADLHGQGQALRWFTSNTRGVHESQMPKDYVVPWMRVKHAEEKQRTVALRKGKPLTVKQILGWEFLRDLHEKGRLHSEGRTATHFTLFLNRDNPVVAGVLSVERPQGKEGYIYRLWAIKDIARSLDEITLQPTMLDRVGFDTMRYTPYDHLGLWKGRSFTEPEVQKQLKNFYFEKWATPKSKAPEVGDDGGLRSQLQAAAGERTLGAVTVGGPEARVTNTPSGDPKDKWKVRSVRVIRDDTYKVEVDRSKSGFMVGNVYPGGVVESSYEQLSGAEINWFRNAVEQWKTAIMKAVHILEVNRPEDSVLRATQMICTALNVSDLKAYHDGSGYDAQALVTDLGIAKDYQKHHWGTR